MELYSRKISPIGNPEARQRELKRLSEIEPEADALSMLIDAFDDPYPPVRHLAAGILADRMGPRVESALIQVIQTGSEEARTAACIALNSENVGVHGVCALFEASQNEAADVRYHGLVSLHRFNHPDERELVERMIREESDPAILVVCCQIASERGWPIIAQIAQVRERLREADRFQASFALARFVGEHGLDLDSSLRLDVIADLVGFLKDETTSRAAAQGLVLLNATQATEALRKVAKGWLMHPIIKVDAAVALHILGDSLGTTQWRKFLLGRRKDARGWAITRAGELKVAEFRGLVEAEARADQYHTDTALIALSNYDDDDAWRLIEARALDASESEVRELANDLLRGRTHAL